MQVLRPRVGVLEPSEDLRGSCSHLHCRQGDRLSAQTLTQTSTLCPAPLCTLEQGCGHRFQVVESRLACLCLSPHLEWS